MDTDVIIFFSVLVVFFVTLFTLIKALSCAAESGTKNWIFGPLIFVLPGMVSKKARIYFVATLILCAVMVGLLVDLGMSTDLPSSNELKEMGY